MGVGCVGIYGGVEVESLKDQGDQGWRGIGNVWILLCLERGRLGVGSFPILLRFRIILVEFIDLFQCIFISILNFLRSNYQFYLSTQSFSPPSFFPSSPSVQPLT